MKSRAIIVLMMIFIGSCRKPTVHPESYSFKTTPITADELAAISGWNVRKFSDAPDDLRKFKGFRMFIRWADGSEKWITSSPNGSGDQVAEYDLRESPILTAFHQSGNTLEFRIGFGTPGSPKSPGLYGMTSGTRENFFPANVASIDSQIVHEGNLVTLLRSFETGTGTTPRLYASVLLEFFHKPMTEAQACGLDLKTRATDPKTRPSEKP